MWQCWRFSSPEYRLDDAWISFRYARHWLATGDWSFNVGGPAVEGFSNPLWTALSGLALWLFPNINIIECAHWSGIFALVLALLIGLRIFYRQSGSHYSGALLLLLLGSSGSLWFYAGSGLESGLDTALFLILLLGLVLKSEEQQGHTILLLSAALAAFVVSRPENLLYGALLIVLAFGLRAPAARQLALMYSLSVALLLVWRYCHFGELLPNTYYAKPASAAEGWDYLWHYLLFGVGIFGLAVLPGSLITDQKARSRSVCLVALAVILAMAPALSGGDWMPGWRRYLLLEVLLCVMVVLALQRGRKALPMFALLGLLTAHSVAAFTGEDSASYPPVQMNMAGAALDQQSDVNRVALVDIGQFGWAFNGDIVDLAGLTHREFARLPGGHLRKWSPVLFEQQQPDTVVLHMLWQAEQGCYRHRSPVETRAFQWLLMQKWQLQSVLDISPRMSLWVFREKRSDWPVSLFGEPPSISTEKLATSFLCPEESTALSGQHENLAG